MSSQKLVIISILLICIILSNGNGGGGLLLGILIGFIVFGYLFTGSDYLNSISSIIDRITNSDRNSLFTESTQKEINVVTNENKKKNKFEVSSTDVDVSKGLSNDNNTNASSNASSNTNASSNASSNTNASNNASSNDVNTKDLNNDPLIANSLDIDNYPGNINNTTIKCLDDAVIDGDEYIARCNIVRNEPTRVVIGMTEAYKKLNRYIKEEVEESEHKDWWDDTTY